MRSKNGQSSHDLGLVSVLFIFLSAVKKKEKSSDYFTPHLLNMHYLYKYFWSVCQMQGFFERDVIDSILK
jgi:hypothetical protein